MNSNPMVTIIIPIYNMEKYLQRAVESALQQTYANLQIILIDDGSTDKSPMICDAFGRQDSRVEVLHKKNGGVSSARNLGIDHAQGIFIEFMDADDYYEPERTERLVTMALEHPCDGVMCAISLKKVIREQVVEEQRKSIGETGLIQTKKLLRMLTKESLEGGCAGHNGNMLYSSQIITKHNVKFQEHIKVNEDRIFNITYFGHCKEIFFLNEKLYHQHIYDRITGSSQYWANAYEDSKFLFSLVKALIYKELSQNEKIEFQKEYANKMITAAVILCRADRTLSEQELNKKLKRLIDDDEVHAAMLCYKRLSRKHSLLVPLFIRFRLLHPLKLVAKYRAKLRYGS